MVYGYAAIGDSLTVGTGTLPGNGFVAVYRKLASVSLHAHVVRSNWGINGLTSGQLLDLVRGNPAIRSSLADAQIITVSIGGNDLLRAFRGVRYGSQPSYSAVLPQVQRNVEGIIREIYTLKKKESGRFMIRAVGLYNPLPSVPEAGYWVERYNLFLQGLNSPGFAAADLYPAFSGRERELLSLDRIHPNARGYRVIAFELNRLGYGSLG
ncbi:GDSL-type esterase/lipase family protein [Paenibacillus sp. JX-17]|uniref:GDSL-type esterase/lipase family protein n=1 Tax=Paenibacillus lacisoli TaxID=3064525 RepID=A0ABT9CB76_9BACL|nr:GDSL-type esterase/lipase family protein [Paenibacillus sp. JX-17]MDO7905904.1 GDSL-type esterase/lipase family protein [Paenibacillus sp. JX-17]